MKVFFKELIVAFCALFLFSAIPALAQKTPDELAKESEDACVASESTKPTPQMIMDKVDKAAALLKKEGKAASRNSEARTVSSFSRALIW